MLSAGSANADKSSIYVFNIIRSNEPLKWKSRLIAVIVLCLQLNKSFTQSNYHVTDTSGRIQKELYRNSNFFKVYLGTFAAEKNSIGYERVISKTISLALSYRAMPGTTMPLKNLIVNMAGQDDKNMAKTIANLQLRHFAITPEIRFYLGKKGYGNGFYIAPFVRYAGFKTNEWMVNYGNRTDVQSSIRLSGKLMTHTEGLMIGAQWNVGKRLCINWWMLGPHHGTGKGEFTGLSNKALSAADQKNLENELNNLNIPLGAKTVVVSGKGASLQLGGLWAGIRGGIAIGLKY